jgi:hypothetical protein
MPETPTITPEPVLPGSTTPPAPDAQIASARATWVAAGHDAAAFDAAIAADGMSPVVPPDAELSALHAEHGLPLAPTATDYAPRYGAAFADAFTPTQIATMNSEVTTWCASMGFSGATGNALIEHLAQIGPEIAKMMPEAKAEWIAEQERLALRVVGSEQTLAEHKARAKAALAEKGNFAFQLANSTVLNSFFLTLALSNHVQRQQLLAASRSAARK